MVKLGTEKQPIILRVQTEARATEVASICSKNGFHYIIGIESDKAEDISDLNRLLNPPQSNVKSIHTGRNAPCPCGSGKKYKKCCLPRDESQSKIDTAIPRCGLCGKTANLTKTQCCDSWICDDESNYQLFSYTRNSCYRNHHRYTLCGYHDANEHDGRWQDCRLCKDAFDTEMYVHMGTNEYNIETLKNPPKFKHRKCSRCGRTVKQGEEGFSIKGEEIFCEVCTGEDMAALMSKDE